MMHGTMNIKLFIYRPRYNVCILTAPLNKPKGKYILYNKSYWKRETISHKLSATGLLRRTYAPFWP